MKSALKSGDPRESSGRKLSAVSTFLKSGDLSGLKKRPPSGSHGSQSANVQDARVFDGPGGGSPASPVRNSSSFRDLSGTGSLQDADSGGRRRQLSRVSGSAGEAASEVEKTPLRGQTRVNPLEEMHNLGWQSASRLTGGLRGVQDPAGMVPIGARNSMERQAQEDHLSEYSDFDIISESAEACEPPMAPRGSLGRLAVPMGDANGSPSDHPELMRSSAESKTQRPYWPVDGDMAAENAPATRYVFDTSSMDWTESTIFLRILHPNREYDQDDVYAHFAVEQVVNARMSIPMVAKMLRSDRRHCFEDDYFAEGQCQALTEVFAQQFNNLKPRPGEEKHTLPLLTSRSIVRIAEEAIPLDYIELTTGFYSMRTQDTHEVLFVLEPNMAECLQAGISFSDLSAVSYPPSNLSPAAMRELMEAFSHFTYASSGEQILVTGLRYSAGYIVEPLVHTRSSAGFGARNAGSAGIAAWLDTHVCNPVCRSIALSPLAQQAASVGASGSSGAPGVRKRKGASDYYLHIAERVADYVDACVPQRELFREPEAVRQAVPTVEPPACGGGGAQPRAKYVDPLAPRVGPPAAAGTTAASGTKRTARSVQLSGCKYVFDKASQRWFPVTVTVIIVDPDKPVWTVSGSAVFIAEEEVAPGVVKRYNARVLQRTEVRDADYYNIAYARTLCAELASVFNEFRKKEVFKKYIMFMERDLVRIPHGDIAAADFRRPFFKNCSLDSKDLLFFLEPADINDAYKRLLDEFNGGLDRSQREESADGGTGNKPARSPAPTATTAAKSTANEKTEFLQVLDTFYHFCYLRSNRYAVVRDAKFAGASGCLVDPTVHTFDGAGFEGMNEGNSSVVKWVDEHKCNALCGLLGLPEPKSKAQSNPTMPGGGSAAKDPLRLAALTRAVCANNIFPAVKYVFDADSLTWTPSNILLRVVNPEDGFAMGAMRIVFEVTEVKCGPVPFEEPFLAKVYRHSVADVVERDYFNEGALQNLCRMFGDSFSRKAEKCVALKPRADTTQLEFIPVAVVVLERDVLPPELCAERKGFFSYRIKDTQRILCTIERKIEGRFTKYNSNDAEVFVNSETRLTPQETRRRTHILEAAEALSHYSLTETSGALLVCDIQGVDRHLTDPEMHTHDGEGLGIGNRGRAGMTEFVSRHHCNFVCKALELPPLNMRVPEPTTAAGRSWAQKLCDLSKVPAGISDSTPSQAAKEAGSV